MGSQPPFVLDMSFRRSVAPSQGHKRSNYSNHGLASPGLGTHLSAICRIVSEQVLSVFCQGIPVARNKTTTPPTVSFPAAWRTDGVSTPAPGETDGGSAPPASAAPLDADGRWSPGRGVGTGRGKWGHVAWRISLVVV